MIKEIDDFIKRTHDSMKLKKINQNLYLSMKQINVLNNYKIEYNNKTVEELLFEIENIIEDSYEELIDLEEISNEISEFNYYHNTKK